MRFFMTKDLTKGNPWRLIVSFALPLMCGNLFQQFYNLVDTIIVGKFLGVNELAAVGSTGSVCFLIVGFCTGICSGFTIPVAQKFGAKDEVRMRKYIANSVMLAVVFTTIMTVTTVLLCRNILVWMRTPENIIDSAYAYIVIIYAGIPATVLYNMTSSIIRAMGDSKTPVYFLVLSAILNIVLDLFCIINLKMGVAGAAVATVVSQAIAGICCLIYMIKKYEILRMTKEEMKPVPRYMKTLCIMGIPMGLQYSITAIGSVVLQSAVNTLGSSAVAAVTAANKVNFLFMCPFDALGSTMATYGGQNLGAKKPKRIREGLKAANVLGVGYSLLALVVLYFFSNQALLMFVDASETAIIASARQFMLSNLIFYALLCFVDTFRFLIQGLGYSGIAVLAGVAEMIARGLAGFILVPYFGFTAAGFASPLAWLFADIFLIPTYYVIMRRIEGSPGDEEKQ